jgi:hypothetical protein
MNNKFVPALKLRVFMQDAVLRAGRAGPLVWLASGLWLAALALALATAATSTTANAAPACDRACLEAHVDRFLDAAIAHDPAKVPFERNVKYTENGVKLVLGDGIWRTLTARGGFRMVVADEATGHIAVLASVREDDLPAVIAVHLTVRNGRIPAAEVFLQRNEKSAEGFDKIGYRWTETVPEAERMSRKELLRVADLYFTGMAGNDGKGVYPFTADCHRIENGNNSTNTISIMGSRSPLAM